MASETTAYTSNGKADYVKDANNNCTKFVYDGHDRLSKTHYPSATVGAACSLTADYEQLTYDAASNVTNVRLRDGNNIVMTFDKLNRLKTRTPTGETGVTFTYNLLGQPTLLDKGTTDVSSTYDALGRLTSEVQPYGSVSYLYDAAGNVTKLTYSDGLYINYDYDSAYRVTKVRQNGATSGSGVLATYTYDNLGRRSSVTYGNTTSRTYAYDNVNRMNGLQLNLTGTTSDLTIGKVGATGTALAYNPASQITSLAKSNDAYAYGGRANVTRSYTTNGLNQYTLSGGVSLGYDARGNLTTSGTDTYTYSKLNEMTSGPGVTAMVYDANGRMISYTAGTTTRFSYAGGTILDERNTSNAILRRYVPGPGTDEIVVWYEGSNMGTRRWLQADERGSIIAITDDSGNIVQINSYDESGIPAFTNLGRFQYTGQSWFQELGLYNFKARFYSASLGRFMQTDPIGYADGMNWYNYAGGDPVNGTDSSGLGCEPVGCGGNGLPGGIATNDPAEWAWIELYGGLSNYWITDRRLPSQDPRSSLWSFHLDQVLADAMQSVSAGLRDARRYQMESLLIPKGAKAPQSRNGDPGKACFSIQDYRQNHDQWVAREAAQLRSEGYLVATEVSLKVLDPSSRSWVRARADIVFTTAEMRYYWINEIKTLDADYSGNQRTVYGAPGAVVAGEKGYRLACPQEHLYPLAISGPLGALAPRGDDEFRENALGEVEGRIV